MTPPVRATMHLQRPPGFGLADAARLAPYMARLGISHHHASPIPAERLGSMHGDDVIGPTWINPEPGGDAGFRDQIAALRSEGMGLIVDIVAAFRLI